MGSLPAPPGGTQDQFMGGSVPARVGYFRIMADSNHTFPGEFERQSLGSSIAWARDSDLTLDFGVVAKALTAVAMGTPTLHGNFKDRAWLMNVFEEPSEVCRVSDKWRREAAKAAGLPVPPVPTKAAAADR